jgi:hypothetical protein
MYPNASKNPQNFHHINLVSLTQGPFSQQAFREEEAEEKYQWENCQANEIQHLKISQWPARPMIEVPMVW